MSAQAETYEPDGYAAGDIPVRLAVRGRRCVIIGGGKAGELKARSLIGAGANVVVVSPDATSEITAWAQDDAVPLTWSSRRFEDGDTADAFLVVSCTGDAVVDHRVVAAAHAAGALVAESAGGSGRGDITFSAGAAIGPVLIGVNSTNRFPSVAAWARDRISEFVDRELRSVIDAATDLRVETKTRQASAEAGVTRLDWKSVLDAGKLVHDRGVSPSEVKEQMRSWLLS